jgi:hypothetical protein
MNIFILTTGRAGSVAFIAACQHIQNFTAAHESRTNLIGASRLAYPTHHIEADNRLSWFLGRLDQRFGNTAMYVHLTREREAIASSYLKRYDYKTGIVRAYREGVLLGDTSTLKPIDICLDYVDTVNENIRHFLKDKSNKMDIHLESITSDFPLFWEKIHAEGDLEAAMNEWKTPRNESTHLVLRRGPLGRLKSYCRKLLED